MESDTSPKLLLPHAAINTYFVEPYHVIDQFKSCPLKNIKNKLDSYELGVVWSYINNGENMNRAQNSIVDCKAHNSIITHNKFSPFINHSRSIQLISHLFTTTQKNDYRKQMEPTCTVHKPWKEQTEEDNFIFHQGR